MKKMSNFDIQEYENTAMREVAAQNYLLSHQEELAQKVVPKAENKPQEHTFQFQVGPYLSECYQYLLEYYDFSGCDVLVDIMKLVKDTYQVTM